MKKLFCLFLVLAMLASLLPAALAEEIVIVDPEAEDEIDLVELAEPEGDPFPLDDPAEPLEEERAPAESIFAEGRGAAESWRVSEPNANSGQCGDKLFWLLYDGTLTISGTGAMWDFTDTAPGWYASRSSVKSIVVEDGAQSIGLNAFINCVNATSVSLPAGLVLISNWAFENCTSLKSITIPKSVQAIGSGAFAYASALTAINAESGSRYFKSVDGVLFSPSGQVLHSFPAGKSGEYTVAADVLAIYDEAFEGCGKLTAVKGGDGLLALGVAAFYGCGKLNSVSLGTQLQAIGAGAFYECGVTKLTLPATVTEIGAMAFYGCTALKSISVPNSVTSIGESCFEGCTALTAATLGSAVSTVPEKAFYGCTKLKSIAIPDSATEIGESAFEGCTSLTSVKLGGGLKTIQKQAFYHCTALKSLTVPGNVEEIMQSAFQNCVGLESVKLNDGVTFLSYEVFSGCSSLRSVSLGNTLSSIGWECFKDCTSLAEIRLPSSMSSLGSALFDGCTSLKKLIVEDGVSGFGASVFQGCTGLKTAGPIGSNCNYEFGWTTSIPTSAFEYLSSLTKVTIPGSVTEMGRLVFYGCTALTTAGPIGSGCSIEFGWTEEIPAYAFNGHGYLQKVTLADSTKRIGDKAFHQCENLTEIKLGKKLEQIGKYAFESSRISSVELPETLTVIGEAAFSRCGLSSIRLPSALTEIGPNAFSWCNFNSIDIPASVKSVGDRAFQYCNSLRTVKLHDGLESMGAQCFKSCTALEKIQIPNSVKEIGTGAFWDCSSLGSVKLPEKLDRISYSMFRNCSSMKSLEIPESITIIDGYAFEGCSSLSSVTIPDGVTEIGNSCFSGCSSLKTITIPDGAKVEGYCLFKDCSHLTSVTLPSGLTEIASSMFEGCKRLESLDIPKSVVGVGRYAFSRCIALTELRFDANLETVEGVAFPNSGIERIYFSGHAPSFTNSIMNESFKALTATIYYPGGDETWDSVIGSQYGGTITWVAYLNQPGPSPVAGLSTAGVSLAWDALEGAESYELQRSADGGAWKTLATVTDGAYTDAAVQMGVTYSYHLRAVIGRAVTDWGDPVEVFFNPFADVSGKKTIEYVAWAYNNDIVKGTGTTSFSPDEPCTRIQFVMMLWKMHGSPAVEGENPFSDISGSKTTKAILWALDKGVINASSRFDPDGNISRVQIVMILWKLAGSPAVEGENPFADVSGSKTIKAVLWAYQNGITKGTSDTTFAPNADCTRVQLVVFLYKYNGIYQVI